MARSTALAGLGVLHSAAGAAVAAAGDLSASVGLGTPAEVLGVVAVCAPVVLAVRRAVAVAAPLPEVQPVGQLLAVLAEVLSAESALPPPALPRTQLSQRVSAGLVRMTTSLPSPIEDCLAVEAAAALSIPSPPTVLLAAQVAVVVGQAGRELSVALAV